MICFKIKKNGKRLCTAGIDSKCVLSAIMDYVDVVDPGPKLRRTLDISVNGLDCETRQHMHWTKANLKPGDQIEITVVDAKSADPPKTVSKVMTPKKIVKDTLGRIRARRKVLLGELKELERNERACLKGLNASRKRNRTSNRIK
jgi:regulator of protease activity HflC (stomatin/prohibitin superfamily)